MLKKVLILILSLLVIIAIIMLLIYLNWTFGVTSKGLFYGFYNIAP